MFSTTPFLRIFIPFASGIVFYSFFPYLIALIFLIPIIFLLLIISIILTVFPEYSRRYLLSFILFLLFFLTGNLITYFHDIIRRPDYVGYYIQNEKKSYPALLQIISEVQEKNKFYKTESNLLLIHNDTQWIPVSGKILLWIQKDDSIKKPTYGDILIANVFFHSINPPLLKTDFNYQRFLSKKNIHHQAYLYSNSYHIIDHKPNPVKEFFIKIRQYITRHILSTLGDDETGWLLVAMTLGIKSELSPEILKQFQSAGVMHVLAVSGLHVGIVYLFFSSILGFIFRNRNSKKWIFLLSMLVIWLYAMLTGLSSSIFRASLMLTLILIGNVIQKKSNSLNSLFAAGFIILLFDPLALYDISFILSFSAVSGILLFYPIINRRVYSKYWLLEKAWSLIAVSISAQIATLPWTLYFFGSFPVYFLPANLIIVPFFTPLLIVCLIGIFLTFIPAISSFASATIKILLSWFIKLPQFFSSLPGATIEPIYISLFTAILLTIFIIMLYFSLKSGKTLLHFISMLLLILTILVQQAWQKSERNLNFISLQYKKNQFLVVVKEKQLLTIYLPPDPEKFSKELENFKRYASQFRLNLNYVRFHDILPFAMNEYPFQAYKNHRWYVANKCKNLNRLSKMNLIVFYYHHFNSLCKSRKVFNLTDPIMKFTCKSY